MDNIKTAWFSNDWLTLILTLAKRVRVRVTSLGSTLKIEISNKTIFFLPDSVSGCVLPLAASEETLVIDLVMYGLASHRLWLLHCNQQVLEVKE